MTERYTRLFSLPENLYAEGSPAIIAAGALLKDNQTGRVVAQLKLRSISEKDIRAVKVCLNLFDTAGSPIGEPVMFDYLDLRALRDAEFGQKIPVPVSDNKARSYNVAVTEVIFGDRSVWTEADGKWEPLSKPQRLTLDGELLKQYQITFGNNSKYEPKEEKDLWYCTCGELNRKGEMCHACCNTLIALQTVDMAKLEEEKASRLIEEAKQAEEEAERLAVENHKKETLKKKRIIFGVVAAVVLIVIAIAMGIVTNSPQYIAKQTIRDGFTCYKNKEFYEAREIWQTVGQETSDEVVQNNTGYTPSNEELLKYGEPLLYEYAYYMSCEYGVTEAIPLYELIPDYKDSADIVSEMRALWKKYLGEYECVSRTYSYINKGYRREPESLPIVSNLFIDGLRYCERTPGGIYMKCTPWVHSSEPFMLTADGSLECSDERSPYTYKYTISADASTFTEIETFHSYGKGMLIYETIWKKIS